MWTLSIPKMLRRYFLHHRELLGKLARAADESVQELMAEAAGDEGLRTGMVAALQTAGDLQEWNPVVPQNPSGSEEVLSRARSSAGVPV